MNKLIRQAVLNEDVFWKQLRSCLDLVTSVSSAITTLESDKALLSAVKKVTESFKTQVAAWLESSALTQEEPAQVTHVMSEREEFCVQPIHIAANLLDPRYRGKNIGDAQVAVTLDWISGQAVHLSLDIGKLISNVAEYGAYKEIWSREAVWNSAKHLNPSTLWQGLCSNQPLSPLACRVLLIPPSYAASEPNRSEFGYVHTKLGNKLTGERVQKLVYVRTNLNAKKVKVVIFRESNMNFHF